MLTRRSRGSVGDCSFELRWGAAFAKIPPLHRSQDARAGSGSPRLIGEERGAFFEEELELVMVDPVAGVGDFD